MEFEFDLRKSEANRSKHGIDFVEAQELWDDRFLLDLALDYGGESRRAVIARLSDGVWTAIYTMRGPRIRIISVRRATKKEAALYDKAFNER